MLTKRHAIGGLLITVGIAVSLWTESAQACALCQTVLPRGDDPLARGLLWSALILLTAPFVVSAAIGGWVYYHYRKSRSSEHVPTAVVPCARIPEQGDQP